MTTKLFTFLNMVTGTNGSSPMQNPQTEKSICEKVKPSHISILGREKKTKQKNAHFVTGKAKKNEKPVCESTH